MKLLVSLFLLFCLAGNASAQNLAWPGWRGPDGRGVSTESGWNPLALKGGARVLWTADVGAGYSNIAVQDNRLYTMGRNRKTYAFFLSCLDAATGRVIWTFDKLRILGDAQSTPATDGTFVFCLGKDATIFCLKASDGSLVWKKDLETDFGEQRPGYGWASSPILEGDLVILNAGRSGLALKKSTGEIAWSGGASSSEVGYYASPVLFGAKGQRTALLFGPEALSAVQAGTGKVLWSFKHGETLEVVADPIPVGTGAFISFGDHAMLLRSDGNKVQSVWKNEGLCSDLATPVFANGNLYGTDWLENVGDNDWAMMQRVIWPFRCIDAMSGAMKWQTMMKSTSAIVADGKLILLEIDGTLHIANASSDAYHEYSKADVLGGASKPRLFTTSPVLVGGRIYCRNFWGDLLCIDVSK